MHHDQESTNKDAKQGACPGPRKSTCQYRQDLAEQKESEVLEVTGTTRLLGFKSFNAHKKSSKKTAKIPRQLRRTRKVFNTILE